VDLRPETFSKFGKNEEYFLKYHPKIEKDG